MKKGVSLIETLIATAIVVVLAGAIFQFLMGGQIFSDIAEAKMYAQERARLALAQMVGELRETSSRFAYIRNFPAVSSSFRVTNPVGGIYTGNSILFKIPCRYVVSGREVLQLYYDDLEYDDGDVKFGAKDNAGVYQTDLYIEYCLVDVQSNGPTPTVLRKDLVRRVWRRVSEEYQINFTTSSLNFLKTSGNPLNEKIIISDIDMLAFSAFLAEHPSQIEVRAGGRGLGLRKETLKTQVTSEVLLRN